ncbi:hypothetical protein [Bacillus atrophaeus]|uniref:hypothetical protein n=1 Tax=Bacillus atrophaeus TaxID=1452 RepID=UPI002E1C6CD6|nr:hypothetical protein [Bacillus atrophaeus]
MNYTTEKVTAYYHLGAMHLKGFVREAGDGLYWFNTEERENKNKQDLLVSATDVKVVVK